MSDLFGAGQTDNVIDAKDDLHFPKNYRVLLFNDDYTTMEFVVSILVGVFQKTEAEAQKIMFSVHTQGVGVCGVYTYEIAETKVAIVKCLARKAGFPLRCDMEEA